MKVWIIVVPSVNLHSFSEVAEPSKYILKYPCVSLQKTAYFSSHLLILFTDSLLQIDQAQCYYYLQKCQQTKVTPVR